MPAFTQELAMVMCAVVVAIVLGYTDCRLNDIENKLDKCIRLLQEKENKDGG